MSSSKIIFASLFSGCGGFDLGFVQEGFNCVAALDNDPEAIEVHDRNFSPSAMNFDLSGNLAEVPISAGVDVLLAGPPCQGFSTAGKRKFDDPRNNLLFAVVGIAARIRPKVVVVENVRGVTSSPHSWYWDSLREGLRLSNYRTAEIVCEAAKMGVAQIRKRIIMLAWNSVQDVRISLPQFSSVTLREAINGAEQAPNHHVKTLPIESNDAKIAAHIKPGQKLCNVRGGHEQFTAGIYPKCSEGRQEVKNLFWN